MVKREDLPVLELMVLEELTKSYFTVSAVKLAADLWHSESPQWGADPVGLVQDLIESLGEMGLVNYRLHTTPHIPKQSMPAGWREYSGFAVHIRLSKTGWELMGYPHRAYQVGTRMATHIHLDAKGDRTNFRKHSDTAEGVGDIEKLPIAEHRAKYPHHNHNSRGEQVRYEMPRNYVKVTDAVEGTVLGIRSRNPTMSYAEIAEETGIPVRTVRYVLVDLPRLRRMSDGDEGPATQKQRILNALESLDFRDVPNLRRTLGRSDTEHDIVHALHDLKKQGLVTFSENANAKTPANIKLTARARKSLNLAPREAGDENPVIGETQEEAVARRSEERGHSPYEGPAVSPLRSEEPEPNFNAQGVDMNKPMAIVSRDFPDEIENSVREGYPILDSLLEREKARLDADNRAIRYLEAAELIRDNDPQTAALLDQKAAEADVPHPSPLESEYLRYVREH